ncbi:unnamed protein product [Clonostachys solani]|uniref:CFEM domain-containing protein n=1 Tax=Clonostachys solani TaxID=160281 RepID=A0A9N9ZIG0_9HYPO|nr:unnamed protein product [Clonostachys solani]
MKTFSILSSTLMLATAVSSQTLCAINCFTTVYNQHPPTTCTLPSMYDCFCASPELQGYFVQCARSTCGTKADAAIQFGVDLCKDYGYTVTVPPAAAATGN